MNRPAHTLIYTHGGGRLGNQVIRWAHWLAWARAHPGEVEIINLGFWPYAAGFEGWRENSGCAFPQISPAANAISALGRAFPAAVRSRVGRRVQPLVHATGTWWPNAQAIALDDPSGEIADLDGPEFWERIASRRVTTCSGWKFSGWKLFAGQQAELRNYFRPAPAFAAKAQEFISALRSRYDVVAGLLIRQTDYRHWFDGRFYFSAVDYALWIRQLLDLHPGRRVGVVIASDEWQDPTIFTGLPCHFATGSVNAGGPAFESFVELSLCDFVVSPPSTFSASAAYVGRIPLWPLISDGQVLAFDQLLHDPLVDAARHPVFSNCVQ